MLKKIGLVLSLLILNIHLEAVIFSHDAIEPSCEINPGVEILNNRKYNFSLRYNHRSYIKELFRKLSSNGDGRVLHLSLKKPYQKKWVDSIFTISLGDKFCKYKSQIKLVGDMSDHLNFNSNLINHSIKLKLTDSNIDGNVTFRIFIPRSRLGDNELFGAMVYRKMGFLSPKTSRINININGNLGSYIIQEEINKEFLESNQRSEGPIFEGAEIFGIRQPISLARVSNGEWGAKSNESSLITAYSLNKLNNIYLQSSAIEDHPLNIWSQEEDLIHKKSTLVLQDFYALSYSMNGVHGLTRDDSRFYFNSIYGHFEPIYYDQEISIQEDLKFKSIDQNTKNGLNSIKAKLANINKDILFKDLVKRGFISGRVYFDEILNKLNKNINLLDQLKVADIKYRSVGQKELNEYLYNKKYFDKLINIDVNDFSKIKICGENIDKCFFKKIDSNELGDIFKQNIMFDGTRHSLFHGLVEPGVKDYPISIFSLNSILIEGKVYLKHTENLRIYIDRIKKVIRIENKENSQSIGRALFHSGVLSDWDISYIAPKNSNFIKSSSRFSKNGLTGCLNFHDITINLIDIKLENSFCEDGVHFMRVKGSIDNLTIERSISDAVDIDFSEIEINLVDIKNATNDCIDLSSGKYSINKIIAYNCGDKGISVGENAIFKNSSLKLDNVLFGVVSKDSSSVELQSGSINSRGACGSAYRKKQEFNGAKIYMNDVVCQNQTYFSSPDSFVGHKQH